MLGTYQPASEPDQVQFNKVWDGYFLSSSDLRTTVNIFLIWVRRNPDYDQPELAEFICAWDGDTSLDEIQFYSDDLTLESHYTIDTAATMAAFDLEPLPFTSELRISFNNLNNNQNIRKIMFLLDLNVFEIE
jgi:hypothetical protein